MVRKSNSQCCSSIPASTDTVESQEREMKQCWISYIKKEKEKIKFKVGFLQWFSLSWTSRLGGLPLAVSWSERGGGGGPGGRSTSALVSHTLHTPTASQIRNHNTAIQERVRGTQYWKLALKLLAKRTRGFFNRSIRYLPVLRIHEIWCGSGSAEPCLWLIDLDLQDAKKTIFYSKSFSTLLFEGTFT